MSKSFNKTILDVIVYAVLIIGALTMLIPFIWMISVSFRLPAQQFSRNIIPDPFTLKNYSDLFEDLPDKAFHLSHFQQLQTFYPGGHWSNSDLCHGGLCFRDRKIQRARFSLCPVARHFDDSRRRFH